MSGEETFTNLASFLNSLDAEGEQKFELSHSLVIICPDCGKNIAFRGRCPKCGEPRTPRMYHTLDGSDPAMTDRTLGELGIPPWDILGGRLGLEQRFYEFGGDRSAVLGPLA